MKKHGFTLVEALVVMACIGILLSLLFPAIQTIRESARRTKCQGNLNQIGVALVSYQSIFQQLPAGRNGCDDIGESMGVSQCHTGLTPEQKNGSSGFVAILPQLERENLSNQLNVRNGGLWNRDVDDLAWWMADAGKREGILEHLPIFWCPSESGSKESNVYEPIIAATSSYAFSNGSLGPGNPVHVTKYKNDGAFIYRTPRKMTDLKDGLSNTFLVGEVVRPDLNESSNVWSYAIANADCLRTTTNPLNTQPGAGETVELRNGAFGSSHPGGGLFLHGDGHVEFLSDSIELSTYQSLSTIAGGE